MFNTIVWYKGSIICYDPESDPPYFVAMRGKAIEPSECDRHRTLVEAMIDIGMDIDPAEANDWIELETSARNSYKAAQEATQKARETLEDIIGSVLHEYHDK